MMWFKTLLISLFLVSPVFAENPKLIGWPPQKIMGFLGLDTRSSAPLIQDGRALDLKNVKLSAAFDLRKRYGYNTVNESSLLDDNSLTEDAVTGIFDADYSDGTDRLFVFVGWKLKYDNSGIWTDVASSGTASIAEGQDYQWKCLMALDNAICTNDYNPPLKMDSTPTKFQLAFTGLSNAVTKAKDMIWYRNYLVVGNTYENSLDKPTRVRWSDVGTIETWDDDNYIDISSLAGDEIIGFAELYGDLYILLRKSIWKASLVGGDDTYVLSKVVEGIGAIARDSIQSILLSDNRRAFIFLSEEKKVYLFNGVAITDIGSIIQPTLNGLSESRLKYAVSVFDGDSYYLCATSSGGSKNDTLFEFQTEIGEWTKHTDINANVFGRVQLSTSEFRTYFGNADSFVYWMDDPDLYNDVAGATGVVESAATESSNFITGAQVLIDTTPGFGTEIFTGATIKITSGTAAGQERVIISSTTTSITVSTAFTTTPDSTSNYVIGAIDAEYETKWYDFGDASRQKLFRKVYMWAEEASNTEIDLSFKEDFSVVMGTEHKSFSPASVDSWDTGLWDEAIWGTTGDKFYTFLLKGRGRMINYKIKNEDINEGFHIYGFHQLADQLDVQ